ncbi:dTMP kinase [Pantoea sp. Aalb]|uniref:dTMP kinase n=1 Tax=Pantoea sp. Aalb TaxID=2576762 RepID=UPI001321CF74|nr:dTMP kinase [Pantoea sp. Aalb]MXP67460.1 dTMP kinase [Pantoea sp. Aalb]
MKGYFIVIEGLEGAGKSTAIKIVSSILQEQGIINLIFIREPGSTPLAEKLRILIKQGIDGEYFNNKAELLMLYAARVQLTENIIKPALSRGDWVIGDRYDLSSQAYQGGGRGLNINLIRTIRNLVLGNFTPDLTFYLDIPPKIGLQRIFVRGKLDRFEKESLSFFERTRNQYLAIANTDSKIVIIDATQSISKITLSIKTTLHNWLSDKFLL